MTAMDTTLALIIVGVLVLAAIVAAAGGFNPRRTRRTVVTERPAERVVERPASPVVEERTTRRVVD